MSVESFQLVPADQFTFAQLAEIYNQGRVDYIVPMPMNARRMEEYVRDYDVVLAGSFIAVDADKQPIGIIMLGLRGECAWLTRLGVFPQQRTLGVGTRLVIASLDYARAHGARLAQLEVIQGNEPARLLFEKYGFQRSRDLLVLNRPPGQVSFAPHDNVIIQPMNVAETVQALASRTQPESWIDETPSMLNGANIAGFRAVHHSGASGWLVFRWTMFQVSHLVLEVSKTCDDLSLELLAALHRAYPSLDTKLENLPADSAHVPIYKQCGYIEVFRRIEMTASLT
jgi:GNAT superfamily N-acetyltransferase